MKQYGSLTSAILTEFPEHPWQPWNFRLRLPSYFKDIKRGIANHENQCQVSTVALEQYLEHLLDNMKIPPPVVNLKLAHLPRSVAGNIKDAGGIDFVADNTFGKALPSQPAPNPIAEPVALKKSTKGPVFGSSSLLNAC